MSCSPPSSPTPFGSSSASTTASSPPQSPPAEPLVDDGDPPPVTVKRTGNEVFEERYQRLKFLLDKSVMYAGVLKQHMEEAKLKSALLPPSMTGRTLGTLETRKKRSHVASDNEGEVPLKRSKIENDSPDIAKFKQPALITGAQLKDYQLEGVEWMISLDQNGISGILADEMGLGKTLQTIAFSAYLRERSFFRPFLVVCPLSVLHNWCDEYKKFAPAIPVCIYHGSPIERAELRKTVMRYPEDGHIPSKLGTTKNVKNISTPTTKSALKALREMGEKRPRGRPPKDFFYDNKFGKEKRSLSTSSFGLGTNIREESDGATSRDPLSDFPVVLTTYEILMRDRVHLARYHWGYIVVDEGHRLKNFDCKLMQEMKKLKSGGRLVLSGTPLQNNLAELWSLLNFILPDIFTSIESFEDLFNLPTMQASLSSERSAQLIHTLHAILKPFLLRRLKADVEVGLPPKKEYILYAPLTNRQKDLYNAIVAGGLRQFLIGQGSVEVEVVTKQDEKRTLRKGKRHFYLEDDDDDDAWLERLENNETDDRVRRSEPEQDNTSALREDCQRQATLKQVNNMKLQNTVMQLRKVCSHPFLFDWPSNPETLQPDVNDDPVNASGKMMVLERLLKELFRRKHKVLLFSQFTTVLDIIEDWATEAMHWPICRIDGSTKPLDRREEMNRFQNGGDTRDAPRLFLLSTRAGGLGVNLVAADTVIFYDQDWNPQMDIQAQDRAHRIGQTKPVLIFRLVSKHTIEEKVLEKASDKRKLEALVIARGKFKMPMSTTTRIKQETMAEMAASLLKLKGEEIEVVPSTDFGKAKVISDDDLDMLLDRSPEVFSDRGKGWTSKTDDTQKGGSAFKVCDIQVDEGNDVLARMMGEAAEC